MQSVLGDQDEVAIVILAVPRRAAIAACGQDVLLRMQCAIRAQSATVRLLYFDFWSRRGIRQCTTHGLLPQKRPCYLINQAALGREKYYTTVKDKVNAWGFWRNMS